MRILITGSTGFIGGHLLKKISPTYDVYAMNRYVTGRYISGEGYKKVYADLKDSFSLKNVIKEVDPEVIIHLASISAVSYSYESPIEVLDTNLLGTLKLIELAMRNCTNLRKFIFASTSETYGNHPEEDFPLTEKSIQYPNSPYSLAKKSVEDYLVYLGKAYDFPYLIARPFNTFGRKDNCHFVVERIITQMLSKNEVVLGDPNPTRDFMYVDDHVFAYQTLLNSNITKDVFNFCTGTSISIKDLADKIASMIGYEGKIIFNSIPPRPFDIVHLKGSYEKANKVLGWSPKYTLEQGLRETIDWWTKCQK